MTRSLSTLRARARSEFKRFLTDEEGVTAIEFGILLLPFLILIFGIISAGLLYFVVSSVERGVWDASRDLRTGMLQNGSGDYNGLNITQAQAKFKERLCARMPAMIRADCASNMRVNVQSWSGSSSISAPACTQTSGGSVAPIPQGSMAFSTGDQNEVVMVTGCYEWTYGRVLPIFKLSNRVQNGAYVVQASATFVAEPFR
jgi:Flp pilus assembly protein TadG